MGINVREGRRKAALGEKGTEEKGRKVEKQDVNIEEKGKGIGRN